MINSNLKKLLGAAVVAIPLAFSATPSHAVPVGLELSLLIDVSGSVDANEYNLQKGGYISAFQSAAVQAAIAASFRVAPSPSTSLSGRARAYSPRPWVGP